GYVLARELEHRRRCVRRDHPMAGVQQVPGQEPAPAPDLDDEPATLADGTEQPEDSRSAGVGVEPEPQVVDPREVRPVVRRRRLVHRRMIPSPGLSVDWRGSDDHHTNHGPERNDGPRGRMLFDDRALSLARPRWPPRDVPTKAKHAQQRLWFVHAEKPP